jgi:hypothetical protein
LQQLDHTKKRKIQRICVGRVRRLGEEVDVPTGFVSQLRDMLGESFA